MGALLPTLFLVAGGAWASVSHASPAVDAKCGLRPDADESWPHVIFILDYEIIDVEPGELDQKGLDIDHLEIVCWRWVEATFDVKVNSGAALMITKSFSEKTTRTVDGSLTDLIATQDRYLEETGAFADHLEALRGYTPPPGLRVSLYTTDDGWAATASHDHVQKTCFAFVGTAPSAWEYSRPEGAPAFAERNPVCLKKSRGARPIKEPLEAGVRP